MKRIMITGFALLAALPGYAQSASAMNTAKQQTEEVTAVHNGLFKALQDKSETAIRQGLQETFTFISANGDLQEKEAFITGFAMNPVIQLPLLETSEEKIHIIGGTAVMTSVVHINIIRDIDKDKTPVDLWERFTETYIREEGRWRLLAMQATYMKR